MALKFIKFYYFFFKKHYTMFEELLQNYEITIVAKSAQIPYKITIIATKGNDDL